MIPKFDQFMYPILEYLKDGKVRTNKEIYEHLQMRFKITDEEMQQKTEKSGTPQAKGNMGWAITFLYQAGLTQKEKVGHHQISDLGRALLNNPNVTFLTERYIVKVYGQNSPKFFFPSKKEESEQEEGKETTATRTPAEIAREAIAQINESVASDLLELVQKMDPQKFEYLVVELMVKMGYGGSIEDAASVTQYSRDEGVDGVIKEDQLGLDTIYLQAKRWQKNSTVGRKEIQAFVGALIGKHSNKGVFITTAQFSKDAIEYAKSAGAKIILIDGQLLCRYMMQFNLGVSTKETYEVKRIDMDYFSDEQ